MESGMPADIVRRCARAAIGLAGRPAGLSLERDAMARRATRGLELAAMSNENCTQYRCADGRVRTPRVERQVGSRRSGPGQSGHEPRM